MSISDPVLKKLWGLSAGRCNFPRCDAAIFDLVTGRKIILGEMAHNIAKSPNGPRGTESGGEDTYDNLILMCPTHHTLVDKCPAKFTADILRDWKRQHEDRVASALDSPTFQCLKDLARHIQQLLIENRAVWETYGPDSATAMDNPLSSAAEIWNFRKLETVVPNNQAIVSAVLTNRNLLDSKSYSVAITFVEHAKGFKFNCIEPMEGVPRFPTDFQRWVEDAAK